jgi:hypothetical protein
MGPSHGREGLVSWPKQGVRRETGHRELRRLRQTRPHQTPETIPENGAKTAATAKPRSAAAKIQPKLSTNTFDILKFSSRCRINARVCRSSTYPAFIISMQMKRLPRRKGSLYTGQVESIRWSNRLFKWNRAEVGGKRHG